MQREQLEPIENKLLCQAILEANRWVTEGEVSAGYRCLLAGLERVQEFAQSGEPWAASLADSYRRALSYLEFVAPGPGRIPLVKPMRE